MILYAYSGKYNNKRVAKISVNNSTLPLKPSSKSKKAL